MKRLKLTWIITRNGKYFDFTSTFMKVVFQSSCVVIASPKMFFVQGSAWIFFFPSLTVRNKSVVAESTNELFDDDDKFKVEKNERTLSIQSARRKRMNEYRIRCTTRLIWKK